MYLDMKNGRIELIIGPMYAGKTTELIRNARRFQLRGKKILAINHKSDVRYTDGNITTHDFDQFENTLSVENFHQLFQDHFERMKEADIILVDELQFFSDAEEYIPRLANKYNKVVIAAGLDGNYLRQPFSNVCNLIPKAEYVKKITSYCDVKRDGTSAPFTKKFVGNTTDGAVEVGGKDKYLAVSREAFMESPCGSFDLILGPMFSGKTTELIRQANRYKQIGKKVLAINHSSDQRYETSNICSHDLKKAEQTISVQSLEDIFLSYNEEYKNADVIVIDEIQFFDNLADHICHMVEKDGKKVIAGGLDGDFMQRPFGETCDLIPLADTFEKLSAICVLSEGFQDASFTRRTIPDTRQSLVGSSDIYMACSRGIYNMPDEEFLKIYLEYLKKREYQQKQNSLQASEFYRNKTATTPN